MNKVTINDTLNTHFQACGLLVIGIPLKSGENSVAGRQWPGRVGKPSGAGREGITPSVNGYAQAEVAREAQTVTKAYSRAPLATRDLVAFLRGTNIHFLAEEKRELMPAACSWQERLFGELGELVGEGVDDQFEPIGHAEFGVDRAEVMRDSRLADEEPFGNLFVLESLRDQRDDFTFSFGERGDFSPLGIY
jgi:hypothetical protein